MSGGTGKFTNPNPKLPDMYILWRDLAQVEHKLEPFARGERTPAAINAAREALHHLGTARHELVSTEVFIVETLKALDAYHDRKFESWTEQVDRPDLNPATQIVVDSVRRGIEHPQDEGNSIPFDVGAMPDVQADYQASTPNYFHTRPGPTSDADSRYAIEPDPGIDLPDLAAPMPIVYRDPDGQPRANADALVGHARRFMDDNSPDCYNCGHPKNAHGDEQVQGPGCGTIVEHGYPCDCLGYAPANPRPVAEIHGRPVGYNEFSDALDELDQTSTQRVGYPEQDSGRCQNCDHAGRQHKFQGCIEFIPDEGNCPCIQFEPLEVSPPE